MRTQERLETITGQLYDGILDSRSWEEGMLALTEQVGAVLFHQATLDKATGQIVAAISNEARSSATVREYEEHHAQSDPRAKVMMGLPLGQMMFDHECFSDKAMSSAPIYADWLKSIDLHYCTGLPISATETHKELLCVLREYGQPPFQQQEQQFLRQLLPQLLKASEIRFHVQALARDVALGHAALDLQPQAIVLLTAERKIVYLNKAAARALAQRGLFIVSNGQLSLESAELQAQLLTAVAKSCNRDQAVQASTVRLPQSKGLGTFAGLHIMPLHASHPLAALHYQQPYALLLWHEDDDEEKAQRIAATLGVTPVEAKLALMLTQGKSVKLFALEQGCSWHTARTHARNLMNRTGTHSQIELVQLVRMLNF